MNYNDTEVQNHKDSHPHMGAMTNGAIRKAWARLENATGAGMEQAREALKMERWLRGMI